MKQVFLLLGIFVIAFGATLLLMKRDLFKPVELRDTIEDGASPDGDLTAKRRGDINRTMINQDAPKGATEVAVDAGASAAPTVGEIEGDAKTDDGFQPGNLKVFVHPPGPEPRLLGGGRFELTGLEPGMYYLSVTADGYLGRRPAEVTVEAGRRMQIDLWLEKGFELQGTVIEDVDQRPIQGAVIDFNGLGSATSDASGSFRTGIVSPKALDIITVTHDDYDRAYLIHPVIPEHRGIVLAMSRGNGTVTGRVIPPSGQPGPTQLRVRIWRFVMENHEELRRERAFRDVNSFEIRGVFDGTNILEVAFPGTTFATRRVEFDMKREPAQHIDIDLNAGGRIEGTFTSTSNLVASQPVILLDTKNHVMGETQTDAAGKFVFDQVAEGEYAFRLDIGIPQIYTGSFHVEAGKTKTLTVDGQLGRLK